MDIVSILPFLKNFARKLDYYNYEDLVHDTIIRLLENKDKFDGTNLQGWAGKIMYNHFVSKYRRSNKFDSKQDNKLLFANLPSNCDQEITLYLKQVLEEVAKLNKHHKEIIMQAALGNTYEELAKMYKIPLGTVRSRISRARQILECFIHNTEIK